MALTLLLVLGLGGCAVINETATRTETVSSPTFVIETRAASTGAESETDSQPTEEAPVTAAPDTEVPTTQAQPTLQPTTEAPEARIDEDGWYDSKEEVALYIHTYGHLPGNYITKKDAEALGWPGGSLEPYAPGKSIGGGRFGNYEGLLPDAPGRKWTECDIDTAGARSRGAKRIVFSNDGLIYYTGDHYESFELLYGED